MDELSHVYLLIWRVGLVGVILFSILLGLFLLVKVVDFIRLLHCPLVSLELTPLRGEGVSQQSTQELLRVLHGLRLRRFGFARLLTVPAPLSLELVAEPGAGIRYQITSSPETIESIRRHLQAHQPSLRLTRSTAPVPRPTRVVEFGLARHFVFSLHDSSLPDTADPFRYVVAGLGELEPKESISYQVVLRPVVLRRAKRLQARLISGRSLLPRRRHILLLLPLYLIWWLLRVVGMIARFLFDLMTLHPFHQLTAKRPLAQTHPGRVIRQLEQHLVEQSLKKLAQPLFASSIRLGLTLSSSHLPERRATLTQAILSLSRPGFQTLRVRRSWLRRLLPGFYSFNMLRRLNLLNRRMILSSSELASLYHLPLSSQVSSGTKQALARSLAPLPSLHSRQAGDWQLGVNLHQDILTPIRLSEPERRRHLFIVGGTGNGKTTLLKAGIIQDIQAGRGVAIIDPHGDLAQELLSFVPQERIKDVIYLNPDDLSYPIGLNLLEIDPTLKGDELLREKDLITESIVSTFRKIFSRDDSGGHRVEYILRNAVQTALTLPEPTLFTVYELINDLAFRGHVVAGLTDDNLRHFWKTEFGRAGGMQQVKMAAGITSKIGRFLFSASARRMLEQPHSTIDFEHIIRTGKILICNVSKGLIGEDTSELLGTMVLAKLQLAALKRARQPSRERQPFYLYVDEFQNFATDSFVQMLSEARKYGLFVTIAEQSTSQQTDKDMVNVILANVGTVVVFRTGNPADEQVLLPFFTPFIQEGEIRNLPPFQFYAKLAGTTSQEPVSGQTVVTDPVEEDYSDEIIAHSRTTYARKYEVSKPTMTTKTTAKSDGKLEEDYYPELT